MRNIVAAFCLTLGIILCLISVKHKGVEGVSEAFVAAINFMTFLNLRK